MLLLFMLRGRAIILTYPKGINLNGRGDNKEVGWGMCVGV